MKKIILLVLIVFFSLNCFSQSYKLIEKAEKSFEKKKYSKALVFLDRAEKADYGFCGTASVQAMYRIAALRFKTLKKIKNDVEMQKFLDNVFPLYELSNTFSIERIRLAQIQFKNSELNNSILQGLENTKEFDNVASGNLIFLDINKTHPLKLYFDKTAIWEIEQKENITYNDALIEYYKGSEYFKLLNN